MEHPGTGKTIFALQTLYNGAVKFNEKGLYVTFEEKEECLKNQAKQFGWDFDALKADGKVRIFHISLSELNKNTAKDIIKLAQDLKIDRLVIDSLSSLSINIPLIYSNHHGGELAIKKFIYLFIEDLRTLKNTTKILISQNITEGLLSDNKISEFLCDGVVNMIYESMGGDFSRSLTIRKMRQTKNDDDIHPLEISTKGLVVHNIK